ncbi:phosphotransferase [Vallitalea okinawensis]|uniref:phosphotransferase n=1 Tax=Vallitalea okinawensis TaxID=2078660 RepID=UPI000CFBF834|nr:phosphotransferase [Vallitalea okinawensis]
MILKTKEFLTLTVEDIKGIHRDITLLLEKKYSIVITHIKEIEDGQNLNFFMEGYYKDNKNNIKLFLKIISKDGYPDIATLYKCYGLLNSIGLNYYNIIHHDTSNGITPYGFIAQEWIEGKVRTSNNDIEPTFNQDMDIPWLRDYANVLKQIHSIKFDYFGDLNGNVKFDSIHEYYDNIEEVVRWSFGNVKDDGIHLKELVEHEIFDEDFLTYVLTSIRKLSQKITPKQSVLIYGDMFQSNIVYYGDEPRIIDWDECRANWWVYEIARTTYYADSPTLATKFIEYYQPEESMEEIDIGIRIEHVKQHLRRLCIMCMNREKDHELMVKVESMKFNIIDRLENKYLSR